MAVQLTNHNVKTNMCNLRDQNTLTEQSPLGIKTARKKSENPS